MSKSTYKQVQAEQKRRVSPLVRITSVVVVSMMIVGIFAALVGQF